MPTFVSPWLLTGGLLIGIPIVLHLVMRERPRPQVFPGLRFLRARREANRRRLRLRHLLLLLLRCAAIALLALAVARPIFRSTGLMSGGRAPVAAAVVIDTRPRMLYRHRNQTRLEAAQQLARQILQELPTDSELVVLDSSSARSRFDVDRGAAAGRIDQMQITFAGQGLLELLDSALRVLRPSDKEYKEVFVLTDMAESDWQQPQQIAAWRQRVAENPEIGVYLVDVGVQPIENFALADLTLSQEVLSENGLLQIETQATTDGRQGQRTVQLYLEGEDGQLQKKGEQTVVCRGGELQSVEFKAALVGLGPHQGLVRFARSDNLTADDVRYFTVSVQPPWNLLVVAPPPALRNARLLTGALAPRTLRRRGTAQYEFEIIDQEQLSQQRLRGYDAIWLLDPRPLRVEVWNRLTSFVSQGGGLAITLGGRAGLTGQQFNASASLELLPAELKKQWKNYDVYLAPDRLEHPVLYHFKSREGDIPWALNPVLKIWELGPLAEGTQTVIHYSDRRPALLARHVGAGRVLVMTTPLGTTSRWPWNHLLAPKEEAWPGFLLVNGMAEYLVGSLGQRLNYQVGEAVTLRMEAGQRDYKSYLLSTPEGTQRVKADPDRNEILLAPTSTAGQYRIEAGGRQGVRYGFSANLPFDETRLQRADIQQLRQELPDEVALVATIDQLRQSRKVTVGRSRWEAYPWLIVLLVLAVAAENLLATFFYRKSAAQPDRPATAKAAPQPDLLATG
ncbi:MAG: hypothetical protein GTO53_05625 [Planctomycetales bacterium]|nr:hypothetical protein [Planctomycetales bacterium]NIM08628.1 hypothetical protein [Planctomycetales bacterium]NIN08096.1 hypothetical protein [Planctomycetales bacterium]NIN76811.1 hypothetical protein [Planctomycetales bacterium]NIO34409.1 hypothetical protein [Planctomycetales bacterium]